ncbi:MAG: hypothetical protein JXQ81_14390, partial [Desulfuromonadales bacterium]|nr:hypothetical protein [Desulfuromonadales bacterium]
MVVIYFDPRPCAGEFIEHGQARGPALQREIDNSRRANVSRPAMGIPPLLSVVQAPRPAPHCIEWFNYTPAAADYNRPIGSPVDSILRNSYIVT